MTTTLTNTGWQGLTTGLWTNGSDTVTDNIGGIVVNPETTANTLAGNDSITGSGGVDKENALVLGQLPPGLSNPSLYFGVENLGAIIMGNGQGSISGTAIGRNYPRYDPKSFVFGIYNEQGKTIAMGNGNNSSIIGMAEGDGAYLGSRGFFSIAGIYNRSGTITIGDGYNNSISGIGIATGKGSFSSGIFNRQGGIIAMGDGDNDSITGTGGYYNGIYNRGAIKMGDGNNDSITGTGTSDGAYGIYNQNYGVVDPDFAPATITMGDGNYDSITGIAEGNEGVGIVNDPGCIIKMGDGDNDSITGMSVGNGGTGIKNYGDIIMGNGNGTITGTGGEVGIYNDGVIKVGAGKDTVIVNGGFAGSGSLFLEEDNDFLKGFGSGSFSGGGGVDTLELTTGAYTVGISGTTTTFTSGSTIMNTTEFEKLIAGEKTLNFSSLMNGQTITVA